MTPSRVVHKAPRLTEDTDLFSSERICSLSSSFLISKQKKHTKQLDSSFSFLAVADVADYLFYFFNGSSSSRQVHVYSSILKPSLYSLSMI